MKYLKTNLRKKRNYIEAIKTLLNLEDTSNKESTFHNNKKFKANMNGNNENFIKSKDELQNNNINNKSNELV